jgi:glycosyltransferase involved in cell wall biosynthesis
LVDDGSTDDSGTICDEYAAKDHRIRVIHQANQGVSAARNRGIQVALGKYFVVPDSDDYVEPTYLEDLISPTLEFDYDIIFSGYIRHHSNKVYTRRYADECYYTQRQLRDSFLRYVHILLNTHWGLLYKLSIIKDHSLSYPLNITSGEDCLYVLNYLFYAHSGCMVSKANYHYINHLCTLSHQQSFDNSQRTNRYLISILAKYYSDNPSTTLIQYLNFLEADSIDHTINYIYQNISQYKGRLKILQSLCWDRYSVCKEPISWRSKLLKTLLVHRMFLLYDIITRFYNIINRSSSR